MIWVALSVLSYAFIDRRVAMFMEDRISYHIRIISKIFTQFGRSSYYIIIFVALLIIGKTLYKSKRLVNVSWFFLLSIIISGLSVDIIKIILGRARPVMFITQHLYGFYFFQWHYKMWSFPSGHAAIAASMAAAMSLLYPRFWLGFFSLAILVAVSRVVGVEHFISDVMLGLYWGVFVVVWLDARLKLLHC